MYERAIPILAKGCEKECLQENVKDGYGLWKMFVHAYTLNIQSVSLRNILINLS